MSSTSEPKSTAFGPFRLDIESRALYRGEQRLDLAAEPVGMLYRLLADPGRWVAWTEIAGHAWNEPDVADARIQAAVRELRRALDDDAHRPAYIESSPDRGLRYIGPVTAGTTRNTGSPLTRFALPIAVAALLAAAIWWWFGQPRHQPIAAGGHARLLVLPVRNFTGDPNNGFLADGMTRELARLAAGLDPERLGVIDARASLELKQRPVPPAKLVTDYAIDYLLESNLRTDNRAVFFTTQLIDAHRQKSLWSNTYKYRASDYLDQQDELGAALVDQISRHLLGVAPPAGAVPNLPDGKLVRLNFLNARQMAMQKDGRQRTRAAAIFQEVIRREPEFLPARIELADLWLLSAHPDAGKRARALIDEAIAIGPASMPARIRKAELQLHADWDFAAARSALNELAGSHRLDAKGYQLLAAARVLGRDFDAALGALDEALKTDPTSLSLHGDKAWYLHMSGDFEGAVRQCRRLQALAPEALNTVRCFLDPYRQLGRWQQAADMARKVLVLAGDEPQSIDADSAQASLAAFDRWEINQLGESATASGAAIWRALAHARRGDAREAMNWLQQSYRQHERFLPFAAVIPEFALLHDDAEYRALMSQLGLQGER